jgi:hypothetical protein
MQQLANASSIFEGGERLQWGPKIH